MKLSFLSKGPGAGPDKGNRPTPRRRNRRPEGRKASSSMTSTRIFRDLTDRGTPTPSQGLPPPFFPPEGAYRFPFIPILRREAFTRRRSCWQVPADDPA